MDQANNPRPFRCIVTIFVRRHSVEMLKSQQSWGFKRVTIEMAIDQFKLGTQLLIQVKLYL